jgi:F-type H+-transporting ATPase subunit epsilon
MLHLEIITPQRIAFKDDVDMVIVPSVLGTMGILPKHVPIFAQLSEGELKIKKGKEEYFLSIGGGFVEVTKTKVMVLVTRAMHAKELNEAEIKRARDEAKTALSQKVSKDTLQAAQMVLKQSLIDMRLLNKLKRRTQVH